MVGGARCTVPAVCKSATATYRVQTERPFVLHPRGFERTCCTGDVVCWAKAFVRATQVRTLNTLLFPDACNVFFAGCVPRLTASHCNIAMLRLTGCAQADGLPLAVNNRANASCLRFPVPGV